MFLFQFKEFLISYNKLTEMCFTDCISDFTSRAIKGKEVSLYFTHYFTYKYIHVLVIKMRRY